MRREEQEEPTETDGVKKNLRWASKRGGDQTILQELMENALFATIDRSISMLQAHRTGGAYSLCLAFHEGVERSNQPSKC